MQRHLLIPAAIVGVLLCAGYFGARAFAQVHTVFSYLYTSPDAFTEVVYNTYPDINYTVPLSTVVQSRDVPIKISYPDPLPTEPQPVIIWSHGGAKGAQPGVKKSSEWGHWLARKGYVVIHVTHRNATKQERQDMCQDIGMTVKSDCETFKFLNFYRLHDLIAVMDDLPNIEADLVTQTGQDLIDENAIALAGHSSGSGAVLTLAGAQRDFKGIPFALSDARPRSFLAFSPQGPSADDGLTSTSWETVDDRPVLTATGLSDSTGGQSASNRRVPHVTMPPGGRYRLFIDHPDVNHSRMNLNAATPSPEVEDWLKVAVLAFVDATLREIPEAQAYINSRNLTVFSAGVADWDAR